MRRAWERNGEKYDGVCFLHRRRCQVRRKKRARAAMFSKNSLFFPVQVWYLGRTTRLPPTSKLIAGVNVDYVLRLCVYADLYVCSRVQVRSYGKYMHIVHPAIKLFPRSLPFAFLFLGVLT